MTPSKLLMPILAATLAGCAQTPAEPCPQTPLRRVEPRQVKSWQDVIDARNAELADAARKHCWIQR